jgi:arylsulfatase A-like enzyme
MINPGPMDPKKVEVPGAFPDAPEVRQDICDYYWEIQRFDRDLGAIPNIIEDAGKMENTIVVITSDGDSGRETNEALECRCAGAPRLLNCLFLHERRRPSLRRHPLP